MKNQNMVLKCPNCNKEIFLQNASKKNVCPLCGKTILTTNMTNSAIIKEICRRK